GDAELAETDHGDAARRGECGASSHLGDAPKVRKNAETLGENRLRAGVEMNYWGMTAENESKRWSASFSPAACRCLSSGVNRRQRQAAGLNGERTAILH